MKINLIIIKEYSIRVIVFNQIKVLRLQIVVLI